MNHTITIPSGTEFLSDVLKELPKNCMFNKGRIGGGGTTLALTNNTPTVICVPFVNLIENKISQSVSPAQKHHYPHEIMGVYSNSRDQKDGEGIVTYIMARIQEMDPTTGLKEYIESHPVPKIVVTYDSLHKVLDYINPKDFHLLIDEYHLLFTEYDYRDGAIRNVLGSFEKFGSFTFMSSTPIDQEFLFDELKSLPIVEATWEDKRSIKIRSFECKGNEDKQGGINELISISIQNCLSGTLTANLYIFVNSVKFIKTMIKRNKLNSENCRVIMSKNNKEKLGNGIVRGGTLDDPKRINFLTSTAFEGADIYDENGYTIMVSNGNLAHTLLDVSTKVQQIAGRIRDTQYNDTVDHVFSVTRYSGKMTEDQFIAKMDAQEEYEKGLCANIAFMPDEKYRISTFKKIDPTYFYLDESTNEFVFDPRKRKIDLFNYRLANNVYNTSVNVMTAHSKNGFETHPLQVILPLSTGDFKTTVQTLKAHQIQFTKNSPSYIRMREIAFTEYPYLQEALAEGGMGFEGIENANYRTDSIQRSIKNRKSFDFKVAKALKGKKELAKGATISTKKAKEIIGEVYGKLGIAKKATSKHLLEYYHTTEEIKKAGGKTERIITIGLPRLLSN